MKEYIFYKPYSHESQQDQLTEATNLLEKEYTYLYSIYYKLDNISVEFESIWKKCTKNNGINKIGNKRDSWYLVKGTAVNSLDLQLFYTNSDFDKVKCILLTEEELYNVVPDFATLYLIEMF